MVRISLNESEKEQLSKKASKEFGVKIPKSAVDRFINSEKWWYEDRMQGRFNQWCKDSELKKR